MAQNNVDFSDNPTGAELMDDYLDKQKENILTSNSGVQRPSYAVAGTVWINNSVTPWSMYIFDGTDDILQGYIDPTNNKYIPITPMTDTGDMIVQGVDDNPARLAAGAVDTVLTSNGVGQLPSYKVNPLGVLKYLPTYTYKENDVVVNVNEEGNIALYKSLVNDNTGNPLTDMTYWEEISLGGGGGGLEIGDIGIAPFGIDESQNKRRYLNGQVISQAQFPGFTEKLKKAVQLYPRLATSEDEWQAEVTNSKLGQCGKFVIDDSLGTIRLPKVVNIDGLIDVSLLGGIKAESLPNITGKWFGYIYQVEGAIAVDGTSNYTTTDGNSGPATRKLKLDASLSSSTYQDNAPVHQEAVLYPYFIQVATGVEESIDVSKEIQLNNPFFFGMSQYFEIEPDNASWLKSDGQFKSGETYKSFYAWLLKKRNENTKQLYFWALGNGYVYTLTETPQVNDVVYGYYPAIEIGTVTAKTSDTITVVNKYDNGNSSTYTRASSADAKRYILDVNQVAVLTPNELNNDFTFDYNTDYDYVINTADTTFRLPIKVKLASGNAVVGNGISLGMTNGTSNAGFYCASGVTDVQIGKNMYGQPVGYQKVGINITELSSFGVTTDPSKSGIETSSQGIYLYFYVGETIQDANIINAAGVLTRVATLSDEYIVGLGMPDYSAGIAISSFPYTSPSKGFIDAILTNATSTITVNGSVVGSGYSNTAYTSTANILVDSGDVISMGIVNKAYFYPLKGVN